MDKASIKRAEIINAAYKVFSEKGYHGARIEDITSELGIAQGLPYRYFQNKLDIFNHVIDEIIKRIVVGISEDAPDTADTLEEYVAQMQRGLDRLFDIFTEDPLTSRLLLLEALVINEETSRKIQEALDLCGKYSSRYVKNGIEKGFLRPDLQVEEMGHAFNAVILEASRRILGSEDKAKARESWKKAIIDLMISGTAKHQ